MANAFGQELTTHAKRLRNNFNRKFSSIVLLLLNFKSTGSLGALAGFAIGVIFTFKFLRLPLRLKKQSKDDASSSSTLQSPSEFYTRTKSVKKKLNGGRKMTCRLLGVILEQNSDEELQDNATVRSSVAEVLLEISNYCDIYLMERVSEDLSVERVMAALEHAGLFKTGKLMEEKVLFCSTENGLSSFVRQLEPDWHVDTNSDALSQQRRFVRNQLHISPGESNFAEGSNIFSSTSLESYFNEGGAS